MPGLTSKVQKSSEYTYLVHNSPLWTLKHLVYLKLWSLSQQEYQHKNGFRLPWKIQKGVVDSVFMTKQETFLSLIILGNRKKLTFREDFHVPSTMIITLCKLSHLTHATSLTRQVFLPPSTWQGLWEPEQTCKGQAQDPCSSPCTLPRPVLGRARPQHPFSGELPSAHGSYSPGWGVTPGWRVNPTSVTDWYGEQKASLLASKGQLMSTGQTVLVKESEIDKFLQTFHYCQQPSKKSQINQSKPTVHSLR